MVRMFARHNVTDYSKWRAVYDEFDAKRRSMGVTGAAVYCNVENGNDVTIYHDFDTLQTAKSFAASSELRETMGRAGVSGQPQIWFVEKA